MKPHAARAGVVVLAGLALVAGWLFWPAALGGRATYVVTHGVSMQPRFHTGDLAILHPAASYHVGEVVGYRSASLHTTVLHRIVGGNGHGWTFRGDNNSWTDADHPAGNQLLGRLWVRIPGGGRYLRAAHSPLTLATLGILVTAIVTTATTGRRRRRTGKHHPNRSPRQRWTSARLTATTGFATALVAAAGAAAAFAQPVTHPTTVDTRVLAHGAFGYGGAAIAGVTYPAGRLHTGDPVFTELAHRVLVHFDDHLTGPGLSNLRGTLRLDVSLAAADGWRTTVTQGRPTAVQALGAAAQVTLDLRAIEALLARHSREVGDTDQQATVTVTAAAAVSGTTRGRPFRADDHSPTLGFTLAPNLLSPTATAPTAPVVLARVSTPGRAPTLLTLHGRHVPIRDAGAAGALVAAIALALAAAALLTERRLGDDPARDIVRRHDRWIVPITTLPHLPGVVDVADARAFERLTEHNQRPILHHVAPDRHTFLTHDDGTTYRHTVPRQAPVARLHTVA